MKLPYSSLTEEFKAAKASNLVTFQESKDVCIKKAGIEVYAGKKTNTSGAVQKVETASPRINRSAEQGERRPWYEKKEILQYKLM